MKVILKALTRSSLSPAKQLIWYIDGVLNDGYSVFGHLEDITKKRNYKKNDWVEVLTILETRLEQMKNTDSLTQQFNRKELSQWVQTAMKKSGKMCG
jgi:hypothetical protein